MGLNGIPDSMQYVGKESSRHLFRCTNCSHEKVTKRRDNVSRRCKICNPAKINHPPKHFVQLPDGRKLTLNQSAEILNVSKQRAHYLFHLGRLAERLTNQNAVR